MPKREKRDDAEIFTLLNDFLNIYDKNENFQCQFMVQIMKIQGKILKFIKCYINFIKFSSFSVFFLSFLFFYLYFSSPFPSFFEFFWPPGGGGHLPPLPPPPDRTPLIKTYAQALQKSEYVLIKMEVIKIMKAKHNTRIEQYLRKEKNFKKILRNNTIGLQEHKTFQNLKI